MTDAEKKLHRIINSNSWDEDFPTNDQMDEIIEQLSAANLTIEQGWQDISTAPKDGTRFLGIDAYKNVVEVEWMDVGERFCCLWANVVVKPTHWRPITPPTE